jgi:hypothetical protein
MAAVGKPNIKGEQRQELVNDLAQGSLTHAQLAEKYDRHVQAIAQFAVRNRAEIAVIRAGNNKALHERLAEIPIADKACRVAVDHVLRDDLLMRLEDPDMDARNRYLYSKAVMQIQRAVAEELGDLRAQVDLAMTEPFKLGEVMAFGPDGQLHEVRDDSSSAGA